MAAWKEQSKDNISLVAAGVAFYGFLALVPMLGAVVLTYGIAADPKTVLDNMKSLTSVLPADVAKLIGDQLMGVVQTSGSKKGLGLILALAIALWGARNAATSSIIALNIAYEEEEHRSFVRLNLMALAITAGGVLMAVLALLAITALGYLRQLLPHLPSVLVLLGKLLSYVVLLLGAAAGAATLYRYAPDRSKARWEWITPGSLFAAFAWLLLTLGFGIYVSKFGSYNKTYGALATVVILITWMYLSAYVLLLGAELNSELERQTGKRPPKAAPEPPAAAASGHTAAQQPPNDKPGAADPKTDKPPAPVEPSIPKQYAAARATNVAARVAGFEKVGMLSLAVSTVGLSLLRKRGQARVGAALVAAAATLSFVRRKD